MHGQAAAEGITQMTGETSTTASGQKTSTARCGEITRTDRGWERCHLDVPARPSVRRGARDRSWLSTENTPRLQLGQPCGANCTWPDLVLSNTWRCRLLLGFSIYYPAGQQRVADWLAEVSWPRPDLAEFHLKLVAAAAARLADPLAIVDAQRRELLRRLRDAQRAAMAEPDRSAAGLLLEGIVLRLQADLRWLEACERNWTRSEG